LKVALDTSNILGRGAVKDTYNPPSLRSWADGIRLLARVLAEQAGEQLAGWAERQGYGRYVSGPSLKGGAEIDWSDPAQRRHFLGEIVADADRLLEQARRARETVEADSAAERALTEAAGLLGRVLGQDLERRPEGPSLKAGVAPDRMPSVHDPEVRHGRKSKSKRFDGHKVEVAADTDSQLITAVEVMPGNAPDAAQALAVVEQTEAATGCAVAESIGDCALRFAGDGATRQAFADARRTLVAKVPSASNQGYFPKTAFTIDLEVLTCTCPGGQTTGELKRLKGGGGQFQFAAAVCGACPLRAQCVRGAGGRTVQLHPQEKLLQAARELQASPAFREYRTRRQVVEHRLARLMQLGLRQARYVGLAKTLFQACLAAAVANLTLLAGEPAAAAKAAAVVVALSAALMVLLWAFRSRPERPGVLTRTIQRSMTAPTSRTRWPLGPPALHLPTAGFRPSF